MRGIAAFLSIVLATGPARAWVYPEHRDIAALAIEQLDADRGRVLERMWAASRAGHEDRLCEAPADLEQSEKPQCLDYASWSAIGGDHSCSGEQMLSTVLDSEWIMRVAAITARLKRRLATARNDSQHNNIVRDSDIELQRADPEYATRAGSNNVHFLLALPTIDTEGATYAHACLGEGAPLNALGAYSWYHASALEQASALYRQGIGSASGADLARAALADEAFALHFLEDSFAAGHVAGTWGDAALRKGTHDYYNEHGLAVDTWVGDPAVLTGDSYMRPEDAERAAATARASLEELLDAAEGKISAPAAAPVSASPDTFDVCKLLTIPAREVDDAFTTLLVSVLETTPKPALAEGLGELPRFRAELGPFVGVSTSLTADALSGGFGQTEDKAGGNAGLGVAVRLGLGLEGVMNQGGDGLVFFELGLRKDSPSTNQIDSSNTVVEAGDLSAAIPGRSATTLRVRMPFWLVPLDLLVAAPFLLLFSKRTLAKMAVTAANGGLIPWQVGLATPIGRFQFVLGREIGASFYGYRGGGDRMLVPSVPGASLAYSLVEVRSIQWDFPVLEYRPFRRFSRDQSSSMVFQLGGGFEKPDLVSVVAPVDAAGPQLDTVWHVGFRFVFDWRSYW